MRDGGIEGPLKILKLIDRDGFQRCFERGLRGAIAGGRGRVRGRG